MNEHSASSGRPWLVKVLSGSGLILLLVLGAWVFWKSAYLLLLVFAGILFENFIDSLSSLTIRLTGLRRSISLAIVCLALVALAGLACWWAGPRLVEQAPRFTEGIQDGFKSLRREMRQQPWGKWILRHSPTSGDYFPAAAGNNATDPRNAVYGWRHGFQRTDHPVDRHLSNG